MTNPDDQTMKDQLAASLAASAETARRRREAAALHESAGQDMSRLLMQGMDLTAENPLVGVPTTLFIAWMRRTRVKTGEQVLAKFDAELAEQGRASLVPGDTLDSAGADRARTFLRDNGLEDSWAGSPEAAQVAAPSTALGAPTSDLVAAPDPLARAMLGLNNPRTRGVDGPQL